PLCTLFSCFFACVAPPRALPSFPTRRSSDLGGPGVDRAVLARPDAGAAGGVAALQRRQRRERLVDGVHRADAADAGVVLGAARQDRKSTRLNSSHVKISYAVFCLKKKNLNSL